MPDTIATNNGLHGDMLFYEMDHGLQFTVEGPIKSDDKAVLTYRYESYDSDEGSVSIEYWSINGDVEAPDGWDVQISTGSDTWDLQRTQEAVNEAIRLHRHLGHHTVYERDYCADDGDFDPSVEGHDMEGILPD